MRSRRVAGLFVAATLMLSSCSGNDGLPASAVGDDGAATASPSSDAAASPTEPTEPSAVAEPAEPSPTEPSPAEEPEPATAPTQSPGEEPLPAEVAPAAAPGCAAGVAPGTTTETFEFEGRTRVYEQVVPSAYDDGTPLPVVLNWHGLGSNGSDQIGFSDYTSLAEDEGVVVIAATGVPSPGDTRNSWELAPEIDPTRDDLAFANALLDRVIETVCVDPARVYSTGMSNGGYFTSLLVCHMSDRIAAAASVAALNHPDDCDPERTVPYIGFHGTDDQVVPYAGGGRSSLAPDEIIDLFLVGIEDEFAEFAVAAGCEADPVETPVSGNVVSIDYPGCPDDVAMTFYRIEGGGHTWPGSIVSLLISEGAGLGVTSAEIDATRVSWEFFDGYSLDD